MMIGICMEGTYDIIMELIEGESLENKIYKTGISIEESIEISIQIAEAMHFLHSKSVPILHKDLKPANILITENGDIKVSDLGISVVL